MFTYHHIISFMLAVLRLIVRRVSCVPWVQSAINMTHLVVAYVERSNSVTYMRFPFCSDAAIEDSEKEHWVLEQSYCVYNMQMHTRPVTYHTLKILISVMCHSTESRLCLSI